MKGLVIWAQSNCRSTMALYRELIRQLNVPAVVTLWYYHTYEGEIDNREEVGFRNDEFADVPTVNVGENMQAGMSVLNQHKGWHHIFTNYQQSAVYRQLMLVAKDRGEKVAVFSESPNPGIGMKSFAKRLYLQLVLPYKLKGACAIADYFVNYSGDDSRWAECVGWECSKIIPFGYFSPPIEGSHVMRREQGQPFTILSSGIMAKHRGADVLVEALRILKQRDIPFRAILTQRGELYETLMRKVARYDLPVKMPGFVKMDELVRLYETCSVYVGAGRLEPWGMRLNDALQCGAPLVVSDGMGGVKLVRDYGCGLEFGAGNAAELADQLQRLITDRGLYEQISLKAYAAARLCAPSVKAGELISLVKNKVPNWWED